ncbi:MAG: hypothetical protein M2R45_03009 [Verrucomicrobia subdivision 3 bacterium]|nr:hypothetical protein [Limisphaerales bacterium]MCS1416505.1 hypothetical protein [Limisphaerales bacterium]
MPIINMRLITIMRLNARTKTSLATVLAVAQFVPLASPEPATFATLAKPFFKQYCTNCHGNEKQKAGLNLEAFNDNVALYQERDLWESVRDMLTEREMPPEKKMQPTEKERIQVVQFINEELAKFDCDEISQPGRVTLRRLNRAEYNNTIRDLMGVNFQPAADFPLDEVGYGFDNIGDVLSLSPILMEKYLAAAEQIVSEAILTEIPEWPPTQKFEVEQFRSRGGDHVRREDNVMGFFREGTATKLFRVEHEGTYRLKIRAYGQQAGPDPTRLSVRINRQEAQIIDVDAFDTRPAVYTVDLHLPANSHRLELGYTNNYNQQDNPVTELNGDRNLFVDYVILEGPLELEPPVLPESHTRLFTETPTPGQELEVAKHILSAFVTRAYRRPVTSGELERLLDLVNYALEQKASFEEAIQVVVQAVLASPSFLYRWELDLGETTETNTVRSLNAYEFASRLSYFLWSSMPDDTLFELAASGSLMKPAVIEAQVKRMLLDPKADALVTNFAGQWLQFRNLETVMPNPDLFPTFDEKLRASMRRESELFFSTIMREDRSLLEFLDADFTYINDRLAAHYQMEGEFSDQFQRVSLDADSVRGGILTQASTLALTANPTRTSPVIRGKWVLEQILGTPPPPPPPDVEELEESKEAAESASLRERLETHRSKAECATCHAKMDPIGFAFENFDAIGAWRDLDGPFPIDASGELPDGRSFDGPNELIDILKTEETFIRTVTEKMLTFALGRGLEYYDRCATDEILAALAENDCRFSTLVTAIVMSDPFQKVSLPIKSQ